MIISIYVEKAFENYNFLSLLKTLTKSDKKGMYLDIIKATYDKPTAKILLNSEKLTAFPLRSGTK